MTGFSKRRLAAESYLSNKTTASSCVKQQWVTHNDNATLYDFLLPKITLVTRFFSWNTVYNLLAYDGNREFGFVHTLYGKHHVQILKWNTTKMDLALIYTKLFELQKNFI